MLQYKLHLNRLIANSMCSKQDNSMLAVFKQDNSMLAVFKQDATIQAVFKLIAN